VTTSSLAATQAGVPGVKIVVPKFSPSNTSTPIHFDIIVNEGSTPDADSVVPQQTSGWWTWSDSGGVEGWVKVNNDDRNTILS